ncbi:monovalent cation:proton antiporter-2 (CPA2) family protein [Nitrosococcus oceani]|uniref:Kef-type potassium/proton antiporter, CPA2 family n=2 Tax=Nitrosococcus oceani TaxID=1229 RepID=Q3J942_NITOC|nr:monovalent cation:proton antiporter-2 (CPA2) family protein [Nitrosococcus oceani]ABA58654.1 Kef-type potassium/proton antiporter, CPA2 family [Nitrosococcus oceani ATCC 19707]GEM19774.1 portal protein [Nitrosococcus oceani]
MEHGFDFTPVLIFLTAAVALVPLFQALGVSPILAYLAAGAIIGPHVLGLIKEVENIGHVAEFGVIFLLFTIGLELSILRLMNMRREVLGLGTVQVLVTALLIGYGAHQLGSSIEVAILIGGGLAFSSTAMVMQLLAERGESAGRTGRGAFSVLLFQDLAVVPFMALLPLLASDGSDIGTALALAGAKAILALLVIFFIGRFLLSPLYDLVARTHNRELFVATTLLIVLGTSWTTGRMGLSLELGAFLAGLLLAETQYRHQVEGDIKPFKGLFLGLFFMSVGMAIDLQLVWTQIGTVLLLLASLLSLKCAVLVLFCRLFGFPMATAVHIGLLLAQGGEFAFVLFGFAMILGIIPTEIGQLLLVTVSLSMVLTPWLASLGAYLSRRLTPPLANQEERIQTASEDLRNHVIVGGFGRVGQTVARLLQNYNVPYIALDVDPLKVAQGQAQGYSVYYGSAAQIDVLKAAGLEWARLLVMTLDRHPERTHYLIGDLHRSYPDLEILVRGRDQIQSKQLRQAGAAAVIPEALEASLQLSSLTLKCWGIPPEAVEQALEEIRREDYAPIVALLAKRRKTTDK